MDAFGKDAALKLLCQPKGNNAGAGCNSAMNYFKNKGQFYDKPEVGDVIFFESSTDAGEASHTGIVYKKGLLYVHTVEGNTSDGKSVVENGGEVCEKKYTLGNSRILGYGRPDYGDPEDATVDETEEPVIDTPVEYIGTATVNAPSGRVNFRQQPSKSASQVKGMGKIKNGEEVMVKTKSDEWAAVEYGKYRGYVMLEFLVFRDEDKEHQETQEPEGNPEMTVETIHHTVLKGETLWGLAKYYYGKGNEYKKIMKANGMKKSVIRPGMVLLIPDVEGVG